MSNRAIPITSKPLYRKHELLRPFPPRVEAWVRGRRKPKPLTARSEDGTLVYTVPLERGCGYAAARLRPNTTAIAIIGNENACGHSLQLLDFTVARGSRLWVVLALKDGSRADVRVRVTLVGDGAHADIIGLLAAGGQAHHNVETMMRHQRPDTSGNIHIQGVYEGQARGYIAGLISIAPRAQRTRSYFRDTIILLDQAMAESMPTLEIEANDVKASHGSTTTRVNDEQLFYLQSRGLTAGQARQLITRGAFSQGIKLLPAAVRPYLPFRNYFLNDD